MNSLPAQLSSARPKQAGETSRAGQINNASIGGEANLLASVKGAVPSSPREVPWPWGAVDTDAQNTSAILYSP